MSRHITFAALIASISLGANAQQAPSPETIAYWNSKTWQEYVIFMGMKLDELMFDRKTPCEGGYGFEPVSFNIHQPIGFAEGQPNPVTGIWTYRFKFKRCGETKIYNLLWKASPGKLPTPSLLPPGMSRASPTLAADLMNGVVTAGVAAGAPQACRSLAILDSIVTMEPATIQIAGQPVSGVWGEQWSVKMCTTEFKVDFCLVPTKSGGTDWSTKKCAP